MTDRDWILLAIGCSIGLVSSFGAFYLLALVESWAEGRLDARKRNRSGSSMEPIRAVPTAPPAGRRVLYGYVSLVVYMLISILGGMVGRFLHGRLNARKRALSRSSTEPASEITTLPPKKRRDLYGCVVMVVFILASFLGGVAARSVLGW